VSGAGCVTTALNVPEQFGDVLEMVTEYVPAESPVMLVPVPLTGPPAGLVRDQVQLYGEAQVAQVMLIDPSDPPLQETGVTVFVD
jgi:hypothetical protein